MVIFVVLYYLNPFRLNPIDSGVYKAEGHQPAPKALAANIVVIKRRLGMYGFLSGLFLPASIASAFRSSNVPLLFACPIIFSLLLFVVLWYKSSHGKIYVKGIQR